MDFKEQMAEARRAQILMGAAQVFAEKGFHKATTKQIAKTAGVSEGTIYNYFENKRDLLIGMLDLVEAGVIREILLNPPDTPREFLKALMRNRYELMQERGHIVAPLVAEIFADGELRLELYNRVIMPLASILEQYFQDRMDAGIFRAGNTAVVTRAFIGTLITNFALKMTHTDPRYEDLPPEALFDELADLLLLGLEKRE